MGDDITIGVTEIVNNIEVTAQPNDQIVDINVTDNSENVTLNITPTVIEINVNKGSSYARWGSILGTLTDQTDLANALILKADLIDGLVPSYQLPSYVDDVIEVANYAALPASGETGKIYITLDTNHIYRWSGSTYIEITDNTAVWGAITGTLSSQTDLVNALNLRVPYTGATSNVNLGEYGLTGGFLALDTTPTSTPTGIGTIYWDSANRTAALIDGDGDTTLQIGQEQRILVHNNTGSTLTDGQVVYVTGSTGNLPSVSLANASSETTSAATLGVVTESIAHGADGFITTSGIVNGLNTLAFNEGDLLWLGTTAGTFTATKPISPNHLVLIGYVIKKAGGNGSILVKIQNTQELKESSDVLFTSLTNNDILTYESSTDLWKNKSIATILGYTPANDSSVVHIAGTETISGIKTFTGSSTVFDYTGASRLIFKESGTEVGDFSFSPYFTQFTSKASGGYIFKNSLNNNSLTISNSGNGAFLGSLTATSIIKSGGTNSQYLMADGSVSTLTNPVTASSATANYHAKFTGSGYAIGNSIVWDNGTNVGIGTTSPVDKLDVNGIFRSIVTSISSTGEIAAKILGYPTSPFGLIFRSYSSGATSIQSQRESSNSELFPLSLQPLGGNVGIGTTSPSYQLQLSTDSAAKPTSALWTIASDKRIKENINSYTKGLNELLKINPITYDYNGLGGFKKGKGGVGIIAQEIAEILPDSVSSIKGKLNETDEEEIDILNFNGHELTYILINAVKELKAEIEILKNK